MRSASPNNCIRLGLLAVCCLLFAGAVTGCQTTQDTAAKRKLESARFLKEREARRDRRDKADRSRSEK